VKLRWHAGDQTTVPNRLRRFEKILQNFTASSASKLTPFHPDAYNLRLSK
jgi:hypothetical protein